MRRRTPWLLLLLLPLIAGVQRELDARLGRYRATEEALFVWSGTAVRRMAPGLENVMADLYWLRTVQYFGGQRAFDRDKRFDLLEPLIEITTTLDPRFELAYRYGAIFLAEPWPQGAGQAEAALRLLEKGAREMPQSWRIRWDAGYFRHLFMDDPAGGARILLEAAEIPEAPYWLRTLAAAMKSKAPGERGFARQLWQQIHDEAEAAPIRRNARLHLDYLDAADRRDALQALVDRFHEAQGRWPRSLAEVVRDRALLTDAAGVTWDYDATTGRVRIARLSPLWRLDRWKAL